MRLLLFSVVCHLTINEPFILPLVIGDAVVIKEETDGKWFMLSDPLNIHTGS